jgi:multidrug efflux pump subunit AcrB
LPVVAATALKAPRRRSCHRACLRLVAEVYGPFPAAQREVTAAVRRMFDATPDVVDVDDSLESQRPRQVVRIDRQKAALLGVSQADAVQVLATGFGGVVLWFLNYKAGGA